MTSKNSKNSSISLKLVLLPVILAEAYRYLPNYFYGKRQIYDQSIPYETMDNFLSEETILDLRNWIKSERRFATVVEAANRGVLSICNIFSGGVQ